MARTPPPPSSGLTSTSRWSAGATWRGEAADLVLLEDDLATIVAAIEEGRSIYANIQTFIRFLFATNLSELVVILLGTAGPVPTPL